MQTIPAKLVTTRLSEHDRKSDMYYRLRELGMSLWGLMKSETHYLPRILHDDEEICGVIYGHSKLGSVMLVATDRRIVFLDKKPLFFNDEDISYTVVSGITLEWVGVSGTLKLYTKLGNFKIRTMNGKAARIFKDYLDKRCIEHRNGDEYGYTTYRNSTKKTG